jgi:hypothetical protein
LNGSSSPSPEFSLRHLPAGSFRICHEQERGKQSFEGTAKTGASFCFIERVLNFRSTFLYKLTRKARVLFHIYFDKRFNSQDCPDLGLITLDENPDTSVGNSNVPKPFSHISPPFPPVSLPLMSTFFSSLYTLSWET